AHQIANQFRQQQVNTQKGKQVYLNTLAVQVVSDYLNWFAIKTDLEASDSWNPVIQSLADTADLIVQGKGKVECRPVLPGEEFCQVPLEVLSDRIGYIAVLFNRELTEATILGFVPAVTTSEIPLSQLRSLDELLEHLDSLSPSPGKTKVQLSQWLQNVFVAGWQSIDAFLESQSSTLAYGDVRSGVNTRDQEDTSIKGIKLIDLGMQLREQTLALVVSLIPQIDDKVAIQVTMRPNRVSGQIYLPPNLKLALLSQKGETLHEVESRSQDDSIQLKTV
ncbi:MAG: DUF1822 family protein, partial [Scytonema sp. CRU_2_7]|nr:DUF1822 family protein [Scytonema sp. CRU_2_7]